MTESTREIDTPAGPARVTVTRPQDPVGTLVLGHGAGGASWSADILAVRDAASGQGWAVVLVDQPWRVAGRKIAAPPATLDRAWVPVVAGLVVGTNGSGMPRPLIVGGRSAGARVACRTAAVVGADGVLCLSFPLHPPGRPERSRLEELRQPVEHGLPVAVVQGERDPFGTPGELRSALEDAGSVRGVRRRGDGPRGRKSTGAEAQVSVTAVPGTHTLSQGDAVAAAALTALRALRASCGE